MRRVWKSRHRAAAECGRAIALVAVMTACSGRAIAQALDLSPTVQPPPIDGGGVTAALRAELERELEKLDAEAAEIANHRGETGALHMAVARQYRAVAHALLARGAGTDASAHAAALMGARLFRERSNLDALINVIDRAPSNDERAAVRQEVRAILRRFAAVSALRIAEVADTDGAAWRAALAPIIAPMATAAGLLTGEALQDPWVNPPAERLAFLAANGRAMPSSLPPPSLEDLRRRAAGVGLEPEMIAEVNEMLDLAARGEAFPEFQPTIRAWVEAIDGALSLLTTMSDADWLAPMTRSELSADATETIRHARTGSSPEEARRQLDRITIARRLIARISMLRDLKVSAIQLSAVMRVLDESDGPPEVAHEAMRRRALRLERALDRMIRVRALPKLDPDREMRPVIEQFESRYEASERELMQRLLLLATDDAALADPAIGTLLADHRQRTEDLQRLREIGAWAGMLGTIRPGAGASFELFTRRLATWLIDPLKRPDALRLIESFSLERRLFPALPFEDALRRGTSPVLPGDEARRAALVAEIERRRLAWATTWTDGGGHAESAGRMLMLRRLMLAMHDAHATGVDRGASRLHLLNRWPGWEVSPDVLARLVDDLITRVNAACRIALREEPATLARALDQLERETAVARLAGRLLSVLGESLDAQSTGIMAALNPLVHAPVADAWPGARRDRLAEICRFVLEAEHARSRNRLAAADGLLRYANHLAADLLRELGDYRDPPPTLRGFED